MSKSILRLLGQYLSHCRYFLSSSAADTVKIYVGPGRKLWTLPEELLCSRVEFFKKAFKGPFKEGVDKEMYFPEDDPASFGHLIDWVFGQSLGCELQHGSSVEEGSEHGLHWCRLGVLADKFGIDGLSASVAAQYEKCLGNQSNIPPATVISYIYENTMDDYSKLRILAVKRYVFTALTRKWDPQQWAQGTSMNATFNERVVREMNNHMLSGMRYKPDPCDIVHCAFTR